MLDAQKERPVTLDLDAAAKIVGAVAGIVGVARAEITMLERAGVPESTVQDIVGRKRSTLTGSVYSGQSTLEMRHDALAKLKYPKA